MTELLDFIDSNTARWARFRLADGDPCWLGIAQSGVLVKRSRMGLLGRKIYEEKNLNQAAQLMHALEMRFPEDRTPSGLWSPVLQPIANAILHCGTIDEVQATLRSAG